MYQLFNFRVFHQSAFFRKLRRGYRPFRNAIILGDSAYTSNYRFMAVPLKQRRLNRGTRGWQRRRIYNFKFCQCRVVVEVLCSVLLIYSRFLLTFFFNLAMFWTYEESMENITIWVGIPRPSEKRTSYSCNGSSTELFAPER